MAAHTKEQWSLVGAKIYSQGMPGKDARRVGEYVHNEDASEAVALHNACIEAGIENPAAIPEVIKAADEALSALNAPADADGSGNLSIFNRTVRGNATPAAIAMVESLRDQLTKALAALKADHADALNGRR